MPARAALTFILSLGVISDSLGQMCRPEAATGASSAKALAYFERAREQGFDSFLQGIRRKPLSPELKAEAIAVLPSEGEVQPAASGRAKLAALKPNFDFHERGAVIEVKVIRVGQAFIGLYARSVLLISEEALEMLTAEELQAAAAHEMGHDYFWGEYELARRHNRQQDLRELELRCDGVALITLGRLGLGPSSLISQVTKMTRFNQRIGATATAGRYPPLDERISFIRAMAELIEGRR